MHNCEGLNEAAKGLSNAPVTSGKAEKHPTKASVPTCVWMLKAKQNIKHGTQTSEYRIAACSQPSLQALGPRSCVRAGT